MTESCPVIVLVLTRWIHGRLFRRRDGVGVLQAFQKQRVQSVCDVKEGEDDGRSD